MKKLFLLLCCLAAVFFCLPQAHAYTSIALPDEVKALCAAAYPDYRIAVQCGSGDDERGQFALVLSGDGGNVLCLAEKTPQTGAYVFTVANDRALMQGDTLPSVLLDSDGDSLYLTYEEENVVYRYHAQRVNGGEWGPVDLIVYEDYEYVDCETAVYLSDGMLQTTVSRYTDEGESTDTLAPVPAQWLAAQISLSDFDISLLPRSACEYLPEVFWRGAGEALLPAGVTALDGDDGPAVLVLLGADAEGVRRVYLCGYSQEGGWDIQTSAPLPEGANIDALHDGDDVSVRFQADGDYARYTFSQTLAGTWALTYVMAEEDMGLGWNYLCGYLDEELLRYGTHPWTDIRTIDFTSLPHTFDEACAQLDRTGWAVVTSDDPQKRLNLRTMPDQSSPSIGKYYRGTAVRVLDTENGWAYVDVYGVNGWMMKKYLVTGADMDGVASAFPSMVVREVQLALGLNVYAEPDEGADIVETFTSLNWDAATIIGVAGDGWYHVVFNENASAGYVRQDCFWAGNG